MSSYFPNVDPVYVYKRKGDDTDPYIFLQQTAKVVNGKVIMKEIPDFQSDVVVKNSSQVVLTETTNTTLLSNQYRVDYSVGIIYFHTSTEGQTVTIEYYGTGYVSFPAERVWIETTGEQAEKTLQDLVDNLIGTDVASLESKVGILGELQTTDKSNLVHAVNENVEKLASTVKKINNISPDVNGNVTIDVGVKSVSDSTINGNIIVDGVEVNAYDDTALNTAIQSKSSINHQHTISQVTDLQDTLNSKSNSNHGHMISDITDMDISNKVDGFALRYDESVDKVVLKSLPIAASINDTSINAVETWSSDKLNTQLSETVYYDEITYEKYRDTTSKSNYYITHVPNKDKNGQTIKIKHGYQNDLMNSGVGETARNFSKRHTTSLAVNASIWDVSTGLIKGVQIQDGIIKQDVDGGTSYTLGIKEDNTFIVFPPSTPASSILTAGCIDAVTGFFPMIQNSVAVDSAIYGVIGNPNEAHPRNVIAQLPNKDILFLTCEGKTSANLGMTYTDVIRILLARGVTTAYCLDGGGSAQTVVRGLMINSPSDDAGKTERKVADFLYVEKSSAYKENIGIISSDIGVVNKRLTDAYAELTTLQDTVSALSAPTWTALPLLNGTVASVGREPRYTKVGKRVYVEGEIANIAAGTIIATLPAGYRPPTVRLVKGAISSTATNDGVTFVLSVNGAITLQASPNTTSPISLMGISFFVD